MTSDDTKSIVRQYLEHLYNRGDAGAADAIIDPDVIFHEPAQAIRGREALKVRAVTFRTAFPDLRVDLDDVLAEGDRVATRWTLHGTHCGEFAGLAATGKTVRVSGITIWRIAGGKIREAWGHYDAYGLMRQLGAADKPG